MIRHSGTQDRNSRLRVRASAATASTARPSDLQSLLATAYLLEKPGRYSSTGVDPRSSEQLFSSLVSLLCRAADLKLDLDEILACVAQHAMALAWADGAAVAITQDHNIVCRARAGTMAPTLGTRVDLRSNFTGEAFRSCEILSCEDAEDDPRVNRAVCRLAGIRSIVAVPIERQSEPIGIIEVFSASPARFETNEIRALELLACVVTDAVEARKALDVQHLPPPLTLVSGAAQPATGSPVTCSPAEVAAAAEPVHSEVTKPEPQVVMRRPRSGVLLRAWLVFSAVLLSLVTLVFIFHQRGVWKRPRRVAAAAPASTPNPIPKAEPGQLVATGPGILQTVKYKSRPDFTSVEIGLSAPVKVITEHLTNPERIYFDLAETRIAPSLSDLLHMKAIAVAGRLVSRLRIAQQSEDVVRMVIDLNRACEYSYVMSQSPPFRLVVEVHVTANGKGPGTEPKTPVVPPAPVSSPTSVARPKPVAAANRPLRIVIDPGHGGSDLGSVGPTGLQEKELVLDVAERLSRLLRARLGAETILTRGEDTFMPLESRSAVANRVGADLFLSIHGNSSSGNNVRGVETFYVKPAAYKVSAYSSREPTITASRRFAAAIQHALYTTLSGSDPLVQDRGVKTAALSVLEVPTMPSVLTEIAFVSSAREEQKLRQSDYREKIAAALFEGIIAYASRTKR